MLLHSLKKRLEDARNKHGVSWEVLERDYLISWVLYGIAHDPYLKKGCVFKGGAALKKCFFGDYRFSEDLDFTLVESITEKTIFDAIKNVCRVAEELVNHYAPITISSSIYREKQLHPNEQFAFTIYGTFPWQRQPLTRILIEITGDEEIINPINAMPILHEYGEPIPGQIQTYSLEEILSEKLRAILQKTELLKSRGWSRSRSRDYYDIWRILEKYRDLLNFQGFQELLRRKCEKRKVAYRTVDDFFQPIMMQNIRSTWKSWLGPLVPHIPDFEWVETDLKLKLEELFQCTH